MPEDTIYSSADAFIQEFYPTQKTGTWNLLRVCPYPSYRYRSLLFFDVSSLPAGTTINSAKLYLYFYAQDGSGVVGRTHKLHRILQDWAESSVDWDTAPSHAAAVSASKVVPAGFQWMDWDVKSDVEKFLDGTYTNKGWILLDDDESSGVTESNRYHSREFGSLIPRLIINHTGIPPIKVNLSDTLAIQAAVTDSWKYQGLGKKLSDSLSMLDHPVFRLNGKILVFLKDQVVITDHITTKLPVSESEDLPPTDDSYIYQDSPGSNYGSQTYLEFGDAEDSEDRCLLLFDLSEIPSTAQNLSAKLFLYFYTDMNLWGEDLPQDIFRVTESWDEDTTTWTNQPDLAGTKTSTTTLIDDQAGWYSWDVTDDVEDFLDEIYTNYGWMLKPQYLSGNLDQRAYSKETAQSQKPYLEVSYLASNKYFRTIKDKMLINDVLSKADTKGQYYRGLSDVFGPITDSLTYRRIPRNLLTDLDLSPAQIVRQEFPVSDIIPKDEVLVVVIETADGQKWKHKLNPL